MILPTKHLSPRRSLIGAGGLVLELLDHPRTITGLWDKARRIPELTSFEQFVLALDFLFALGVVEYDGGLLRRLPK